MKIRTSGRVLTAALALASVLGSAAQVHADPKTGSFLLSEGQRIARNAHTLEADMVVVLAGGENTTAVVRLMKPNFIRITMRKSPEAPRFACDGTWSYITAEQSYFRVGSGSPLALPGLLDSTFPPLAAFFRPDVLPTTAPASPAPIGVATPVGHEQYLGVPGASGTSEVATWYFNELGIPAGAVLKEGQIKSVWLQNVKLDLPIQPKDFLYQVPTGFKPLLPSEDGSDLLPVGSAAPEFTLPGLDGPVWRLRELRKRKPAILLHFWSHDSPDSYVELPQAQALHQELAGEGLLSVAVNVDDAPDTIGEIVRKLGVTFTNIGGRDSGARQVARNYAVAGRSASYLIDSDGRILWRGEQLDLDAIRKLVRRDPAHTGQTPSSTPRIGGSSD